MTVRRLFANEALLADGWRRNVLIEIDGDLITRVTPDAASNGAEITNGAVIAGMPNLHSHAFQRAMAGLTERSGPRGDNFWSWRELMYRFLERITPDDNEVIATQLYIEMLKSGYTSVAEFHYLHRDEHGNTYANPAEMADRIIAAAVTAGIGLTMLPVFYAHATFGGTPPDPGQKRFIHDVDSFNGLVDSIVKHQSSIRRVGIAPHSLRAVTPEELTAIVAHLDSYDRHAPIHIHAAEQLKEVDDCRSWSNLRPVAWLLNNVNIDARWCLVHATHLNDDETYRLAACGAVAGLCPSTEANLGDGIFNAPNYFLQGGSWGIGGDSHVGVDPFRELSILEYAQRLKNERRNILQTPSIDSIGGGLYRQALAGGARALGQNVGVIGANCRADLVVMNGDDMALAEHSGDTMLDAAIFGPVRQPVRDVMAGGVWVVRDGHHADEGKAFARYRTTLRRLLD